LSAHNSPLRNAGVPRSIVVQQIERADPKLVAALA
jgi:hypothetical protein